MVRTPGYPPYAASIMDGYAVSVDDIPPNDGMDTDDDTGGESLWTHVVKARVYAGDLADGCTDTGTAQDKRAIDSGTTDAEHDINQEDDDDIQSATSSQLDFDQNDIINEHQEREINDLLPAYYVTTGAIVPNGCNLVK